VSLILDALNRSRQDTSPVPGLETQHPVEHISTGARQYLPWAALLVALLLIGWLVWERGTGPSVTVEEGGTPVGELSRNLGSAVTAVTTELKARAAAPPVEPPPGVAESVPTVRVGTPSVEIPAPEEETPARPVEVPTPDEEIPAAETGVTSVAGTRAESAAGAAQREPAARSLAVEEDPAVAELYQQQEEVVPESPKPAAAVDTGRTPAQKSPAVAEQPVDIEAMLRLAQEELENASLDAHPAPFLASLSQQTKDGIPTIYYQRHEYSSQASGSTVVLNGKSLKAGGSPLPGMKVDEILPDSVVLSYKGTQFRLRALNSWINL
jgi:general secretion pathway protein B